MCDWCLTLTILFCGSVGFFVWALMLEWDGEVIERYYRFQEVAVFWSVLTLGFAFVKRIAHARPQIE